MKIISLRKALPASAFTLILSLLMLSSCTGQNSSQDWPQWMGPERDGTWNLDLKKTSLDKGDMLKNWELDIGSGYSGPTVADGKVYLMDLFGDDVKSERVLCVDAESGQIIWSHSYEVDYSIGYPTGPRASVLINDGRAYSMGTMGHLFCLDANTGAVIWEIDGEKEYRIDYPIWGLAASPIIEDDLLIVQMGGRPGACVVAFDKQNGKEIWRALGDEASYSAPIVIDQAGHRVLVCWTGDNLVGMSPSTGNVFWKIPYDRKKSVINISDPVLDWPYLFLSSFYDGSMLVELSEQELTAKMIWLRTGMSERNTDALHCIISTPFIQGEFVYGVDSYGEFRCLDLLTGDRIWTDSTLTPYGRWSNAHFARQNNKIWAFNEKGELVLGEVSPKKFTDLGRVKLIDPVPISPNPRGGVNWAFPAFAGRKIYARSDAMLVCWEVLK